MYNWTNGTVFENANVLVEKTSFNTFRIYLNVVFPLLNICICFNDFDSKNNSCEILLFICVIFI
jgi:hypothetical protein